MYPKELINIINGSFINIPKSNKKINKFKMNSKDITKNDVFIAYGKGINFCEEAIKKGCLLIISDKIIDIKTKVGIIKVDDIKDTLIKLGTYIRSCYKDIPLIAVTGSVGKSTTTSLIANILSNKRKVLYNKDNKNNYLGVTETLFKLDNTYDVVIIELGMNHSHEIEELSIMIKPDISIITNIGTSHIGNLGSKNNILKAKMEIIKGMNNGLLLLPSDDKYLNKVNYKHVDRCYSITTSNINVNERLQFILNYDDNNYEIDFPIPNKYYINNIIFAFKIGIIFEVDPKDIINSINTFEKLDKRMNIIKQGSIVLIDDCYNSSYESLKSSLEYISNFNNNLIILADILELGKYSKKIHQRIDKLIKKLKIKEVLLVGQYVKYIDGLHFNNNKELINYLDTININNKIILIKGSRKMALENIKDYILKKRI